MFPRNLSSSFVPAKVTVTVSISASGVLRTMLPMQMYGLRCILSLEKVDRNINGNGS